MDLEARRIIEETLLSGEVLTRDFGAELRRSSDDKKTVVIINTRDIDAHESIVEPSGVDLSRHAANPVFLINHDYRLLAGVAQVNYRDGRLISEIPDSAWDHEDPEIERWFRKVKAGIMRGVSLSFIPKEWEFVKIGEGEEEREILRFARTELTEFSFVTVGSNASALVVANSLASDALKRIKDELAEVSKQFKQLKDHMTAPVPRGVAVEDLIEALRDERASACVRSILESDAPQPPPLVPEGIAVREPKPALVVTEDGARKLALEILRNHRRSLGKE